MKIRKLDGKNWGPSLCACEMAALGTTILALDRAQNSTAPSLPNSHEFQERCAAAIVALANQIVENVERHYVPETKRFRVQFDVKRVGNLEMTVEAETEEDAKNLVQNKLDAMERSELDGMKTDFLEAGVYEVEEVRE